MTYRKFFSALLLAAALLCACAQREPAGEENPAGTPAPPAEQALLWGGLDWSEHLDLTYAQSFAVDFSPEGCAKIVIDQETYLLVPEDGQVPAELPEDVTVLRQPLDNIYLQATSAMDCFRRLDAIDAVTLSGTQAEGWYIPEARQAMEDGRMAYAGKYSAPDYELIKSRGCGLALTSTMIYHNPEVKEQLERLGIPVLVERSSYESHPLGRMEWIKLYGVLLGRRQEAEDYFAAQLERLEPILEQENTGRTVAFFSVTSNGSVTVRKSGDYIAKAIALATINIQMETFYDQARDADVLIYNSAIEADLDTIEQLVDKSAPLADFKAVKSGDVWCTGKSMFQESQSVGDMMLDIHAIVSEENPAEGSLTYLHRLK